MPQAQQPNIVLINCDDLGYGDPGCYGSRLHDTPALDRMAAEGLRFTDFYMPAPVCTPSRGGMLTGCYPPRIGFGFFDDMWVAYDASPEGLHPREITIAKLLKNAGYATAIVGKWHCGDQAPFLPAQHGFDHYYGLPGCPGGRSNLKPDAQPLPLMRDGEVIEQQPDISGLTERYVEDAVRFIRTNRARPFFLYFAHLYVHTPLFVPEHFRKASRNGRYGAAVHCIDWATAALLHELKAQGLDDNTLVVFTSDNGSKRPEGNVPLRGRKGSTWEGGMRVPCIMRWPGRIPAGGTCRALTTAMDFYPTFAALGGAEVPVDRIVDGKDIRSLMFSGGQGDSPYEAFFYYKCNSLEAVRAGRWKLHVSKWRGNNRRAWGLPGHRTALRELYDLKADPGETRNLYDEHPDVVADLLARLEACRADLGDYETGTVGRNVRPIGRVDQPVPLTRYDPAHPYMIAEYDLDTLEENERT